MKYVESVVPIADRLDALDERARRTWFASAVTATIPHAKPMDSDRPTQLLAWAREIASAIATFHEVRGPGPGDHATREFMQQLRERAVHAFRVDYSERKVCGETSLAVDFYFPEEATVVEVALGLPNPGSEYEKDVLKAIMAQDYGNEVRRLFFISRPGAVKKCEQPGRTAVREWAFAKHQLVIEVHELEGEPRRRRRSSRKHP